jgi:von Willebrand factor type A domain
LNFSSLTYQFPHAVFLLLALFLILPLFAALFIHRRNVAHQLGRGKARSQRVYWGKAALFSLGWLFLTFSLTEPASVSEKAVSVKRKVNDVTFLIDTSTSMSVPDTRTKETRLSYAKEIADLIASELNGDKAALYTFGTEPHKIVPETFNTPFLRFMLDQIQLDEGGDRGTDIQNVLEKVVQEKKTYILLSDGGDADLEKTPQIISIAKKAPVYTIGLGSKEPSAIPNLTYKGHPVYSALNSQLLKEISKAGFGTYYNANQMTGIEIAKDLKNHLEEQEMGATATLQAAGTNLYFYYPLLLAILCLILYLTIPDLLLFLCMTPFLQANELEEAAVYYQAKDFARAEIIYEALLQEPLSPWERSVVHYNLATAEIAQGRPAKGLVLLDTVTPYPAIERNLSKNKAVALFRIAKKIPTIEHYQEALEAIEHAKLANNSGLQKLEAAAKVSLALLLQQQPPKTPLEQLERTYQRTLANKILFPQLIEELNALHPDPNLDLSLKALKEGNPHLAKLYLLEAKQNLKREKWAGENKTALLTLGQAIEELRHLIILHRENAPKTLLAQAQERALTQANPFLPMVYAEQRAQGGCQEEPWDKALPLFNQGFEKAASHSLADQESALFQWVASYYLIKDYKPKPEAKKSQYYEVLNHLQQMRQQDNQQLPIQPLTLPGVKPW